MILKWIGGMPVIIDESAISVSALLSEIEDLEKELRKSRAMIDWYKRSNQPGSI